MNEYLYEYLIILFWYIVPCFCAGLIVLFIRFIIKPKDFIYRKVLHLCAVATVFCFILPSHTWWIALLDVLTIIFLIDVTLLIVRNFKLYRMLFVDKEKNEIFIMINTYYIILAALIAFFYGFRGDLCKYLVISSILSWGLGDAFAAIIGISFGKHKLNLPFVDSSKTIEGSIAMFIFSYLACLITLLVFYSLKPWVIVLAPLTVAISLTITEAISKKGLDTITCPLVAALIIFLFTL